MKERTMNLFKAAFGLFVAVGCIALKITGTVDKMYPYIGAVLGLFVAVNFVRKAFED